MKWRGKLLYQDLEGGVFRLQTKGETLILHGSVPRELVGQEVEVDGERQEGVGIFMAGPMLKVRSVRKAG